jgi:hypothetical protein
MLVYFEEETPVSIPQSFRGMPDNSFKNKDLQLKIQKKHTFVAMYRT